MTTGDKVFGWFMGLCFYYLTGTGVGLVLDAWGLVPLADDAPASDYAGVILLWPLFVIKFLAIGLWAVVYSGFNLLF